MFFKVQGDFLGTFVDFPFIIIPQERISAYVDPCKQILQLLGIFQNAAVNVARNWSEWTLNSCDQVTFRIALSKN